jgi:hypothetical protein
VDHLVRVDQSLDTLDVSLAGARDRIHSELQLLINSCRLYQLCQCSGIK